MIILLILLLALIGFLFIGYLAVRSVLYIFKGFPSKWTVLKACGWSVCGALDGDCG